MKCSLFFLVLFSAASVSAQTGPGAVATYSIVAWDSLTGDLGVAVQSRFLAVGAVVPFARAGVGAIATQAFANTTFGPRGLDLMARGMAAQEAGDYLLKSDTGAASRQIGIVDARGNAFAYTGTSCQPYAGHIMGRGYTAQGNILAGEAVVKGMARAFEIASGDLADRLMDALDAAEREGGDRRGRQSAALLVVRDKGGYGGFNDRFIDLRVDNDSLPLVRLRRLLSLWKTTFIDARLQSVEEFNRARNYSAARTEMQRIVEAFNAELRARPDDPDLMNRIARSLASHDIDRQRGLELSKRAATLAPARSDILDTMAECHFLLGHYDEAVAIETTLVTKEPANDFYWKQLQKFKDAKRRSGNGD